MKTKNKINTSSADTTPTSVIEFLEAIARKRTGGAINLRGINFQLLYASRTVLGHFSKDAESKSIQLEGIEDIDLRDTQLTIDNNEYVQLKTSQNSMNAGTFWNLNVLQNFLEVYLRDKSSKFRLVYNMRISDGNLKALIDGTLNIKQFTFWSDKFNSLDQIKSSSFDLKNFLNRISYEYITADELTVEIFNLFFQYWNVNKGTEIQHLKSLFYQVFNWSEQRSIIEVANLNLFFQEVADSFSKAVKNEAITHDWINEVDYKKETDKTLLDYFDGKAARPIHVANAIPARRKHWERELEKMLREIDVSVILSSSGQGKSTLAWQVGYNLRSNFNIYELNNCNDWISVNSILDFLKSRVCIGQLPLVIIDGLNSMVGKWHSLAEKCANLPVKFLITSRQEDWYRFGADESKISLKTLPISLNQLEAKEIFQQLKSSGKLHTEVKNWEPLWEQIQQQGLLIEYTFLLTRGQMIEERLRWQIKILNEGKSGAAKIEILRLIALADCMNLNIETSKLVKYINNTVRFDQDRGEVFKELENEYYVNFGSRNVIGLHPVRSRHLLDILHETIPIEESLINLYDILNMELRYEFFVNVGQYLNQEGKKVFFEEITSRLANDSFSAMVYALDGILHGEPEYFHIKNKKIFDEAFDMGGIELFVNDTIPFTEINFLNEMSSILSNGSENNFAALAQKRKDLTPFVLRNSDVAKFASALKNALSTRTAQITSYQGLEFLKKWFDKLEISLHIDIGIDITTAVNMLETYELQEAKEIFAYLRLKDPDTYNYVVVQHKKKIISYLKLKTNTLTMVEIGEDLHINYLLFGNEVAKANEFSVFRIETIEAFLPGYAKYCTEAILLPFPSEQVISVVRMNSTKQLTTKALGDLFDQHINQIWSFTIMKNYSAETSYHWQKEILDIRTTGLVLVKDIIRMFDAMIEGNSSKLQKNISLATLSQRQLGELLRKKRNYPSFGRKYFDEKKFSTQEKIISSWFSTFGAFNNQFTELFNDRPENKRHLALINYKKIFFDLETIQAAFAFIEQETFKYFDTSLQLKEEKEWYARLYHTILYYLEHIPLGNAIPVAKKTIAEWWSANHDRPLRHLKQILSEVEAGSNYRFISPNRLIETETLTFVTFGIDATHMNIEEELWELSTLLAGLADHKADFYSMLNIVDGICLGGIRFSRDYFEYFQRLNEGEIPDKMSSIPLPIAPDQEAIATLSNVSLPEPEAYNQDEKKVGILFDLWKLSEYRNRLDRTSNIEMKWLEIEEQNYWSKIVEELLEITEDRPLGFKVFVEEVLADRTSCTNDIITNKLFSVLRKDKELSIE